MNEGTRTALIAGVCSVIAAGLAVLSSSLDIFKGTQSATPLRLEVPDRPQIRECTSEEESLTRAVLSRYASERIEKCMNYSWSGLSTALKACRYDPANERISARGEVSWLGTPEIFNNNSRATYSFITAYSIDALGGAPQFSDVSASSNLLPQCERATRNDANNEAYERARAERNAYKN